MELGRRLEWTERNREFTQAKGVPAPGNVPGARAAPTSWRTSSGDFWLFGGSNGEASATTGSLNDLWRYSAATGQWTWMSGSSEPGAPGAYGSRGVASSSNVPGARNLAMAWTDGAGALWLFGGLGIDSTGNGGNLNDLWKFDPTSDLWDEVFLNMAEVRRARWLLSYPCASQLCR